MFPFGRDVVASRAHRAPSSSVGVELDTGFGSIESNTALRSNRTQIVVVSDSDQSSSCSVMELTFHTGGRTLGGAETPTATVAHVCHLSLCQVSAWDVGLMPLGFCFVTIFPMELCTDAHTVVPWSDQSGMEMCVIIRNFLCLTAGLFVSIL